MAGQLEPRDTVVTFNYDHAPELLANVEGSTLRIIEPAKELGPLIGSVRTNEGKAPVLKVHRGVTWRRNGHVIEALKLGDPAIGDPRTDVVIGVPGPGKRFLISEKLRSLDALLRRWDSHCWRWRQVKHLSMFERTPGLEVSAQVRL